MDKVVNDAIHEALIAGKRAIQDEIPPTTLSHAVNNPALQILKTQEDPESYCWTRYLESPDRTVILMDDQIRAEIRRHLEQDAGLSGDLLARWMERVPGRAAD